MTQSCSLQFRQGSSDKVYHAAIVDAGDGLFNVTFQYGRRGSTLVAGTKNQAPIELAAAEKIYAKLVNEKLAKGYTEDGNGTPFQGGDNAERVSGFVPQLLNAIDDAELERLLSDPHAILQEKFDGHHRAIAIENGNAIGINRRGLTVALPLVVAEEASCLSGEAGRTVIDGELIGNRFVPFDLIEVDGKDLRQLPYETRLAALENLLVERAFQAPRSSRAPEEKREHFDLLRARKAEGVVFKDPRAAWGAGRPHSGGPALKFKFVASATVVVGKGREDKRSIGLYVSDDQGALLAVGNCTIPANVSVPPVGSHVEIEYLYFNLGGSLYQPVFLHVREDKDCPDTLASLKLKGEDEGAG